MMTTIALLLAMPPASVSVQETDQRSVNLNDAAAACIQEDFDGFFEKFVWSADVRRQYTAPTILEGAYTAPARPGVRRPADVQRFEIAMLDYTYVDAASADRNERDGTPPTHLWLKKTPLAGGGWRVEYQRAITRPGEGDGVEIIRKIGTPRAYVFVPVAGCWRLERWLK